MRLLADENFNRIILRELRKRIPDVDIVRVQDTILYRAADPIILEWAAKEGRILLTHDVKTMTGYAYERVAAGLAMPGVIQVPMDLAIGQALGDLMIVIGASKPEEWANQVIYLPL